MLHRNDIGTDNRASNLYYGTRIQKMDDALRNGRNVEARKTHCANNHEFTPENTLYVQQRNGRVWRRCIECRRSLKRGGVWRARARRRQAVA